METKLSLCKEQGYICCYCGRRINGDYKTQIEHFYPKGYAQYKELQLDYETNLLACCDGGKSERKTVSNNESVLFCEATKGEQIITVNPLTIECEDKFLFDEEGEIFGVSKDAEVTIKILNLNSPVIKNMRKNAIKYYEEYCVDNKVDDWEKEITRLDEKDEGKYEEFCFVLQSYVLHRKLGR